MRSSPVSGTSILPPSSEPPLKEPLRITPEPSLIVQFTVSPPSASNEATLKCSEALCSAVFGSTTKVPLPLPWVDESKAVVQLAVPTVVSEYADVWCTDVTSITALTSVTAFIGWAVGVMLSDAVSFVPSGAVTV